MKKLMLASVAVSALMVVSAQAHADNNQLTLDGRIWNYLAGKTNTDGTATTSSNGKNNGGILQQADSWEAHLGSDYVPGKGNVPTATRTFLEDGYNLVKETVSNAVKGVVTAVATPVLGPPAAAVLGGSVAAGAVTLGETSADWDMGKKVDSKGSVARAAASAAIVETVGQVIPGGGKGVDAVKSMVQTSVETAINAGLADKGQAEGSVKSDLGSEVIDIGLTLGGARGPAKDAAKAALNGALKDIVAGGPKITGPGGIAIGGGAPSPTGGTPPGLPAGHGGGTPNGGGTPTSGGYGGGDTDGHTHGEDHHGEGSDTGKGEGHGRVVATGSTLDPETWEPLTTTREYEDGYKVTTWGGTPNPEDGSGNSGHDAAKLDQMGIHIGGWGRNDGDSSGMSSSSPSTGGADHAGGGTDLFEPSYDTQGGVGRASGPGGSSGEGMGDGNSSEGGKGPGEGGGSRSHGGMGSSYAGNTADGSGWGSLDQLPMAQDAPTTGQLSTASRSAP